MVFVNKGEMAGPGAPLIRVVNLNQVQVRSDVSEAYVGKVSKGDVVRVHFPALGETYESPVTAVGQVIDPNNRTFTMEVALNNTDGKLKPNLVGTIRLRNSFEPDQIQVPSRLIQSAFSGDFVYVMDPKRSMALRRDIELGPSYGGKTVIRKGLKSGELLVDGGFRNVSDSAMVAVHIP
jgi:RND family efflux transporter MFP subunit